MKFLSLFAGIGGLDLGCEMAGWESVYQCEIDPFCRAVLAKHWPGVPRHGDVRTLTGDMVRDAVGAVDAIVGGVPCQPASLAGKRKGADDERWLWGEFVRLVCECRPAWVIAENVPGFLSLADSSRVFRDLSGAGYETWPVVLGACDVGAPQRRKRVWIIGRLADSERVRQLQPQGRVGQFRRRACNCRSKELANARCEHCQRRHEVDPAARTNAVVSCPRRWPARPGQPQHEWEPKRLVQSECYWRRPCEPGREADRGEAAGGTSRCGALDWESEFELGGVPYGVQPALVQAVASHFGYSFRDACKWVARNWKAIRSRQNKSALKSLGNAVVPQCAAVIARAILETAAAAAC